MSKKNKGREQTLDVWEAMDRRDRETLKAFSRSNKATSPAEELAAMREVNRLLAL